MAGGGFTGDVLHIGAPQPTISMRSGSQMLSFKDVYVKDNELHFTVSSRDWNGNVRVDFKAWDPFDEQIDFGTARLCHSSDERGRDEGQRTDTQERTPAIGIRLRDEPS